MLIIDKYAYINDLKNFNPMAKFLFAIGTLFIAVIINNLYLSLVIFLIMFFVTTIVAKVPIKTYIKLYILPGIFLFFSIIPIILSIGNIDNFIWFFKIGSHYIGLREESINITLTTIFRVFSCLSSTYFLALTTPINQLIQIFKKIKISDTIIELLILIYRFIFIFLEESKEIFMAQEMKFGYDGTKNSFKSFSILVKCLFIRVLLRYKDMVIALDSKLYDGEFKIG